MIRMISLLVIFAFVFNCMAQDKPEGNIFEYTKVIHESLKKLKDVAPENYVIEVDNYRKDLEKYFDQKKRVCEGEFSTVIFDGIKDGDEEKKPVKLKPEERKLCFRELKALQLTFINNMFVARKKYLEFLHKERLKDLEVARENAVKSLQGSFDKKSRR